MLETDTNPTMRITFYVITHCLYCIGKTKETSASTTFGCESFGKQVKFPLQHLLQSPLTYVALSFAVNDIANSHVVS